MTAPPDPSLLRTLSREVALLCDAQGAVRWADERARLALGVAPGARLTDIAPPGCEDKVERLLHSARETRVAGWELTLPCHGRPCAVTFSAAPHEDGVLLVGSFVAEDYGTLLAQTSATLGELAALHRDSERQKNEILQRTEENRRLSRQLDDSARGVIALHAEIDEKSDSLRRAGALKSRMVANVSHEFRTPLNSIIGLARLLLSKADGELSAEQEKQLGFILKSADALSELVNDLLDLSKIEAGKVGLRADRFQAGEMVAALRGIMRPLNTNTDVELVFEDAAEPIPMETDEAKISQVLRNLVSNALKFTEHGSVRVQVRRVGHERVRFDVVDTGIGIAPENHEKVFEEFSQIDSPMQRRVKGTGLGLSLSRRLAEFLGGTLTVQSRLGEGSCFSLTIPAVHPEVQALAELTERSRELDPRKAPVLVVEDDRQTLFLYERYLRGSGFQVIPARTIDDARQVLRRVRPSAIVLDVMLEGETSWQFLGELKSSPETRQVPVLVVTVMDREQKARALGADEFYVKPIEQEWLLGKLTSIAQRGPVEKVLVIDDDEVSRYLVRRMMEGTEYRVLEAASGGEGVRLARQEQPHVIFLDFFMPGMSAFEVLDELKIDPTTRNIPVIIHTSKTLSPEERERLQLDTSAIVQKQGLTREVALSRIREALQQAGLGQGPGKEQQG